MQIKMFELFVAFCAMEANFIACGIGYRTKTEKEPENFNTIRMGRIFDFEMMQNPVEGTNNWNI